MRQREILATFLQYVPVVDLLRAWMTKFGARA